MIGDDAELFAGGSAPSAPSGLDAFGESSALHADISPRRVNEHFSMPSKATVPCYNDDPRDPC